jgi:hypothetical protein
VFHLAVRVMSFCCRRVVGKNFRLFIYISGRETGDAIRSSGYSAVQR